jgi:hypothetical protein
LDIVSSRNLIKSISLILDMLVKYYNVPCYNFIIDENFCELIARGINMNDYFESNLPLF